MNNEVRVMEEASIEVSVMEVFVGEMEMSSVENFENQVVGIEMELSMEDFLRGVGPVIIPDLELNL